jgi:hypothetical protein
MTDKELIAQLKNSKGWPTLGKAAAARIEALTAKNEMLGREVNIARYGQPDFAWSVHVQVMDDLNAKLAKAVEALVSLVKQASTTSSRGAVTGPHWTHLTVAILKARAAIAEIEGEKT